MRRLPALLVLPTLTVIAALWLAGARGPFWLARNLDPAYLFLLNGLNVARGLPPDYYHGPGSPAIVVAGLTIRLTHFVAGEGVLVDDVLRRPESYLAAIHGVLLGSYALALLVAGFAMLRVTGSLTMALVVQSTPFLTMNGLLALLQVSPEPLLMSLSLLFIVLVVTHVERGEAGGEVRFAFATGAGAGLLVATKFTALPLAALPLALFVAPLRRRAIGVFALTASASFVAATWVIRAKYPALLPWIIANATRSGRYGRGPAGFANFERYWWNLWSSMEAELFCVALMIAASAFLALTVRARSDRGTPREQARVRLLTAMVVMLALQFLLSSKQPIPRYFVPALGTLGCIAATGLACLGEGRRAVSRVRFALAAAVIGTTLLQGRAIVSLHDETAAEARDQLRVADEVRLRYSSWPKIYGYPASSIPYALHFGNQYAFLRYTPELSALYPDAIFFDPFAKAFRTFARPVPVSELASQGDFLYQGPPFAGYKGWRFDHPEDADFRLLLGTPIEELYEASFRKAEGSTSATRTPPAADAH